MISTKLVVTAECDFSGCARSEKKEFVTGECRDAWLEFVNDGWMKTEIVCEQGTSRFLWFCPTHAERLQEKFEEEG